MNISSYKILITIILIAIQYAVLGQNTPKDLVFNINVETNEQQQEIKLSWNKLPNVTGYRIYKKLKGGPTFNLVTNKLFNDTTFVDNNVQLGTSYEYSVMASHTNHITGYVCSGMNISVAHSRGNVLLVIDSNYLIPAQIEIDLFKRDLIKDGWKVLMVHAGRTEDPLVVKQRITNCHGAAALQGVILMGHIPVPYSGNIAPDAHSDHIGAWPADVYYGDMCNSANNIWHDAVQVNTSASSTRNHQIIGDGKFDVSQAINNTSTKIFVGRIDVVNMSYISSNDVNLFKQYINKNHAYRASINKFKEQGLIDDNFGFFYGEAFAQNGWRNMSALLGADKIVEGDYMTDMKTDSYLWSYACGGGWNTGCSGVGNTIAFGSSQIKSVFTMLYGSYFGDWDVSNNFLRAPIASPSSTLVSFWAGRPNWFMHTMALGDPIGYSYLNTVDNVGKYHPQGFANAEVHHSLQGDPTLRMYVYEAPTNLEAFNLNNGQQVKLEWLPSIDTAVIGYYVYRATSIDGDFQLMNQTPITSLTYIDANPLPTTNAVSTAYMVRAVKLEQSNTGSFYNLSPGEITEGFSSNVPLPVVVNDFYGNENEQDNQLFWDVSKEENIVSYEIERGKNTVDFNPLGLIEAVADEGGQYAYDFVDTDPLVESYYRLKITDLNGTVSYHEKIVRIKRERAQNFENMSLYPNPATNSINIIIPAAEDNERIEMIIYDLRGRVVATKTIDYVTNTPIVWDVHSLAPNQYIMKYYNQDKRETGNLKFVKID